MDDYPNLYFTIKEENSTEERQTIANRLKRNPIAPSHDTPGDDNADIREMISRNIFDHLVEPYVAKVDACDDQLTKEISAECINVVMKISRRDLTLHLGSFLKICALVKP